MERIAIFVIVWLNGEVTEIEAKYFEIVQTFVVFYITIDNDFDMGKTAINSGFIKSIEFKEWKS